jgi:hypothetical protein
MKRCKIMVTITKFFEAEFEDTLAASNMFRTLERDPDIGVLSSSSGRGWKVSHKGTTHTVRPEDDNTTSCRYTRDPRNPSTTTTQLDEPAMRPDDES